AHAEDDGDIRSGIDRGSDDASRDHDRIGKGEEWLQRLPRDLELVGWAEEISVVRGEHHRVAIRRPDDPREPVLESPWHRRAFRRAHRDLAVGDLNRLASSLWAGPTFEEKALAISLLDAFGRSLDAESWRLLDAWAGESSGWGLCDSLALGPITKIVHSHPRR